MWASRGGVEGNGNDRPGTGGRLVFTRIVGRLIHKPLFAGLVDPSNDTGGVSVDDVSRRPDQVLSLVAVGFVRAGTGVGGGNVVDWREGSLVPVFERGGVNWGLVDLVKEEVVRVWIKRLGIGPTFANRWVVVGELLVNVNRGMGLGVVGGEERATHGRLDEGEGAFCWRRRRFREKE